MNTSQKLAVLLAAAGLFTATRASAQTSYAWNVAGDGVWTTPTNWTPNGVPGGTDTATIDDVVSTPHSQTVTYDISAGTLNAPITLGTLNLLNSAGATFTDVLNLTSTATTAASTGSTNPQGVFTVANAVTLGATAGTVELRLTPTAASGQLTLQDAAGITVNSGGLITLNTTTTANPTNAVIRANTTISGGTLSVLGASSVSGFGGSTSQRNSLSMSSGNITFGNTSGRLVTYGDLIITGGTITGSSANTFELYGVTNSINNVTYANPATITYNLRNNLAGSSENLSSNVDLPNLVFRNGLVTTVTSTSAGQNVASINIGTTASTLKLGSNLNTPTLPTFTIAGSTVDLNNNTLSVSAAGSVAPTATVNFTTTGTSGTISAATFDLAVNTTAANTVGANVTLISTASPTGAANLITRVGLTSGAVTGNATLDAASTLVFTGNSTSAANNRLGLVAASAGSSIGNLVVGTGTSTTFLQLMTGPFTIKGNASVLSGSSLDINGRTQTLAGKLQGTGIVSGGNAGGLLTFASTGGISPGLGGANTGSGFVGALTLSGTVAPITLIGTSVSIFDLASNTSFDSLAAGNNTVAVNGALNINLLSGYSPTQGQTWNILTGLNAGSTGTFSSITDAAGDTFSFGIVGTNGVLTLTAGTAVPEPSTWVMGVVMLACAVGPVRRAFRKRCEA